MSIKIIAVVPCRANSKRLEGKNTRDFCGKPLFCWSVDVAHECSIIDKIIISTNDSKVMNIYEERYSSYFNIHLHKRPEAFAKDDSSMESVIHDLFKNSVRHAIIVLLQPTSPLRESDDIYQSYGIFKRNKFATVVSVFREDPLHFKLNGAIYIFHYQALKNTKTISGGKNISLYVMDREKSWDIDTAWEFEVAEGIMKKRIEKIKYIYEEITGLNDG